MQLKNTKGIWFVGDQFLIKSYGKYFQNKELKDQYVQSNFEAKMIAGYETWNKSYVGRVRNALIRGFNENGTLPRYLVFILDNELIKAIQDDADDSSTFILIISKMLNWLTNQVERATAAMKDTLPSKSKRELEPQIIWIAAPVHADLSDNHCRKKFNEILKESIEKFKDMKVLKALRGWDYKDPELVSSSGNNYTGLRVARLWGAIDSAIKFWEGHAKNPVTVTGLLPTPHEGKEQQNPQRWRHTGKPYNQKGFGNNKYYWSRH